MGDVKRKSITPQDLEEIDTKSTKQGQTTKVVFANASNIIKNSP